MPRFPEMLDATIELRVFVADASEDAPLYLPILPRRGAVLDVPTTENISHDREAVYPGDIVAVVGKTTDALAKDSSEVVLAIGSTMLSIKGDLSAICSATTLASES